MAKNSKFAEDQTETEVATETAAAEPKVVKSIVPSKYAGKYKDPANADALRKFVVEQTQVNGKTDLDKFYALCLANGVSQEQVDKYKALTHAVDAEGKPKPVSGAAGRAVMTLRNLMTPKARKGEGMTGLDGVVYDVKLPPAPVREKATPVAATTSPAQEA